MLKKLLSFFSNSEPENTKSTQSEPVLNITTSTCLHQSTDNHSNIDIDFEVPPALQHPPGIMAFTYLQPIIFGNRSLFDLYQRTEEKAHRICTDFFDKSALANQAKNDIHQSILLWENTLELLPLFVKCELWQYGELPPTIECRDKLPDLYKRLGKWVDAKRVIDFCTTAGAYPNGPEKELADLELYSKAANIAVNYIKTNPGTLQKDLYKLLANSGVDQEMLKRFTRTSLQINKEPTGKTNKLFFNDQL